MLVFLVSFYVTTLTKSSSPDCGELWKHGDEGG